LVTVTLPEVAVPEAFSVPDDVEIGVPHVVSPGPYRLKETVPEGWLPLESVAVSETLPPAGTEPDGVVAMVGLAFGRTVRTSPPQELWFRTLLASPE
jgi:hypothetical protein